MAKHPEGDTADTAADLAALRKDIARLAESVAQFASHQTPAASLPVPEVLPVAAVKGTSAIASTPKLLRWVARGEVEASIAPKAVTGLTVALGVGLLLGILLRPRR